MEDNIELIVTSIKELTKKRRLVYINYEPAFAVYTAELRKFGIKENEAVSKETFDTLVDEVLLKRATIRAMALLKNMDYRRKGLEDKLNEGYYPDRCIEHALEYVSRFGYINDERFAENYVNFKAGNKPRIQIELKLKQKGVDSDIIRRIYIFYHATSKSRKQIENLLYQKGIPADIVESECENYYSDNDDVELKQAIKLLNKKLLNKDKDYENISKAKAYLYRKGFNIDIINKAVLMLEN